MFFPVFLLLRITFSGADFRARPFTTDLLFRAPFGFVWVEDPAADRLVGLTARRLGGVGGLRPAGGVAPAKLPRAVPTMPPRTAPTGPPMTAPTTTPVAPPATCLFILEAPFLPALAVLVFDFMVLDYGIWTFSFHHPRSAARKAERVRAYQLEHGPRLHQSPHAYVRTRGAPTAPGECGAPMNTTLSRPGKEVWFDFA